MKLSSRHCIGRVVSIISAYGGEGRNTLCANVSAALARLGKETIAVDAQIIQAGLLSTMMGLENRIAYSLVNVVAETCDISEACVRHGDIPGLKLFSTALNVEDIRVMREKMESDPEIIRRACDDLRSLGDFVVIDTSVLPRGLEMAAPEGEAIVVVTPYWHSVYDAKPRIEAVRTRGKHNMRLVINRMPPEKNRRRDDMSMPNVNEILEILQLDLLGIVPRDDYLADPSHYGQLATLSPGSPAGQEYQNIARRLLGEKVPFRTFKS